jgi:hypothetical protein
MLPKPHKQHMPASTPPPGGVVVFAGDSQRHWHCWGDLLQPKANPTDKKGFKTEVLKPLMSAFSREG